MLQHEVERSIDKKIVTPKDFIYLSGMIQGRIHKQLSVSTLKRVWGYIDGYRSIRESTLDILCQFIGYPDYATFVCDFCETDAAQSSHRVMAHHITSSDIAVGTRVAIEWNPNRRMVLWHRGNGHFIVTESVRSKVTEGDTFVAHSFAIGHPVVLTHYVHNDEEPCLFVIGNKGGLTSITVIDEKPRMDKETE